MTSKSRFAVFLAAAALLVSAVGHAKPRVPTLDELAANPKMSAFTVSPNGQHIAAIEARGEDNVILVWSTNALSDPPNVIGSKVMKILGVRFIKDDVLAVDLWQPYNLKADTTTKRFISKLFFTDITGKDWREPLPQPRAMSEASELEQSLNSPGILDSLPNDPDNVLVVNATGVNQNDIYKVNVRTNRAQRIQRAEEKTFNYVTDLEGNIRARSRADTSSEGSYIATEFRNAETGEWEEHFRSYLKTRDVNRIVAFSKDPNIAFIQSNVGRDKAAIYEYDVKARKLGAIAFQHKFFDAGTAEEAAGSVVQNRMKGPGFGDVWWFAYLGPRSTERYFVADWIRDIDTQIAKALDLRETQQRLVDPATGESATVSMRMDRDWMMSPVSASNDLNVIVFAVSGPAEPSTYWLLRNKTQLVQLAKAWPNLDARVLGQHKLVYYKARDGLDIPAFLHTPDTELCGPGPWPTVVHPHGGPWARDAFRFDGTMWIPLMVSRCMAVLQPQYRGSSNGWGRRLWMAGDAEWGQKMQDDKDDGAKWLIEQKIAIPGRIAMFGFSYGGYAAMAAAVRPNGLYKCAIAGAGVSDIDRIWARFYTNPFYKDRQGDTVKGLSPLSKADQIQIPIYVWHGDRDQTVPIKQSEWFVAKAKSAGKPVVYKEFKDFAHGPSWTRATYRDTLAALEDYLLKGCGGGGL